MEHYLYDVAFFAAGLVWGWLLGASRRRDADAARRLGDAVARHEARVWRVSDEP